MNRKWKIVVVGTGMSARTLTVEAIEAISNAKLLFGSPRLVEQFKSISCNIRPFGHFSDIAAMIAEAAVELSCVSGVGEKTEETAEKTDRPADEIAILVSGDVGFFSAAMLLGGVLTEYELRFIPGISSVNAMFSALGLPWQDAAFISAHARPDANIADTIRRNQRTFCLTGKNTDMIGAVLSNRGFNDAGLTIHFGENLGMESQRIGVVSLSELMTESFSSLTVLVFVNDDFDDSTPCGLPDACFIRADGVPMTKSEIRAVIISKMRLRPNFVCWDIGAGTGSVTVETALGAWRGHVYAVEQDAVAARLVKLNCARFRLGNVSVIHGASPIALRGLPVPDAVFVGGGGADGIDAAVKIVLEENPRARIVMSAITLETAYTALTVLEKAGLRTDFVQLGVAAGRKAGRSHMLESCNPIFVISAGGVFDE